MSESEKKDRVLQSLTDRILELTYMAQDQEIVEPEPDPVDPVSPEPKRRRFAVISNEDIGAKKEAFTPKATKKQNISSWNMFAEFCGEIGVDVDKFNMGKFAIDPTAVELDEILGKFFLSARKENGEFYKSNTLLSTRYALARIFKEKDMDIIHGKDFLRSSDAFKVAERELKSAGKGATSHHEEITDKGELHHIVIRSIINLKNAEGKS